MWLAPNARERLVNILAATTKWRTEDSRQRFVDSIGVVARTSLDLGGAPDASAERVVIALEEKGPHSLMTFFQGVVEHLAVGNDSPVYRGIFGVLDDMLNVGRSSLHQFSPSSEVGLTADASKELAWFSQAVAVAQSVAIIRVPGVRHGTGFLVGPNLLLTCMHVLQTQEEAVAATIMFGYASSFTGIPQSPVLTQVVSDDGGYYQNAQLDFALVRLKGHLDERPILPLRKLPLPIMGTRLNIIHFPAGKEQQITLRSNRLVACEPPAIFYTSGTEQGSSGAPVLNDAWEVLALHNAGGVSTDYSRPQNKGIVVSSILASIPAPLLSVMLHSNGLRQ